jgi:hypothetical protein
VLDKYLQALGGADRVDPDLLWMGTSVGRWEDDATLVVDSVGFTVLDSMRRHGSIVSVTRTPTRSR